MKCPKCGLINEEGVTHCDCGYNFATGVRDQAPGPPPPALADLVAQQDAGHNRHPGGSGSRCSGGAPHGTRAECDRAGHHHRLLDDLGERQVVMVDDTG